MMTSKYKGFDVWYWYQINFNTAMIKVHQAAIFNLLVGTILYVSHVKLIYSSITVVFLNKY